jgi:hypothetical protein
MPGVLKNPATHPVAGFWGERKVTWMKLQSNYSTTWREPFGREGWTALTLSVLETRGTVLGFNNNEEFDTSTDTGRGRALYVCFGYAAGSFPEGAWAQAVVTGDLVNPADRTEIIPMEVTGNEPVLKELAHELISRIRQNGYIGAGVYISISKGFTVETPEATEQPTLDMALYSFPDPPPPG